MTIWRSLILPFYPASLVFVGLSAALLSVTALAARESAILRVIPAFFLLSWLCKYAYCVLDDAANGLRAPPVPSVDMLGPFERRPLLQLLLAAGVYKLADLLGGAPQALIFMTYLALLPASIGMLAVTEEMLGAINPVALLRTAWAMGWYYLLILLLIAFHAYALSLLKRIGLWEFFWYVWFELAVLSIFGLIGGVIFVRRDRLGFEPRSSPERKAAAAEAERLKRRARVLDEVYGCVRIGADRRAVAALGDWLARVDAEHAALDIRAVMTQAAQWNSKRGFAAICQCVVAHLVQGAQLDLALETLDSALRHFPGYALDSAQETLLLARRAKATGHAPLARALIENFAACVPGFRASVAAQELLRDPAP